MRSAVHSVHYSRVWRVALHDHHDYAPILVHFTVVLDFRAPVDANAVARHRALFTSLYYQAILKNAKKKDTDGKNDVPLTVAATGDKAV